MVNLSIRALLILLLCATCASLKMISDIILHVNSNQVEHEVCSHWQSDKIDYNQSSQYRY